MLVQQPVHVRALQVWQRSFATFISAIARARWSRLSLVVEGAAAKPAALYCLADSPRSPAVAGEPFGVECRAPLGGRVLAVAHGSLGRSRGGAGLSRRKGGQVAKVIVR